ncbi:hypothetical protein [Parvularcula lutaonensis]|uniref:Lipoprotein n=1 Tax=Parvularcula lutaonensis TaxID=491923 RepID=A0ABV7MC90_9PROT|nr:hypothetical protein [Parvularcula lutaonensis]GGY50192.1 hypothetical protein GCM10007148_18720 [Parvularcula lutaonensis]
MPKSVRVLSVIAALLALTACETQPNARRGVMLDNPFRNDSNTVITTKSTGPTPMQICSSASLAEERTTTQNIVRGAQESASVSGQTVLERKLKAYSAEFEIAHRSMVRSCQLYANCMDRNNGDEGRCTRSEMRLAEAEGRYYDLIRQRDLLASQARISRPAGSSATESDCSKKTCGKPKSRCKAECDTTANIFTDDCCPTDKN